MAVRDKFFPALLEMVQRLEGVNLSETLGPQAILPSKLALNSSFLVRTIPTLERNLLGGFGSVQEILNASICWVWVRQKKGDHWESCNGAQLKTILEESKIPLHQLTVRIANRFGAASFVGDKENPKRLIVIYAAVWDSHPSRDPTAITIDNIDFVTEEADNELISPYEFLLRLAEAQASTHITKDLFQNAQHLRNRLNDLLTPQEQYIWNQLDWLRDPSSKRRVAYELGEEIGVILLTDEEISPEFQTPETQFLVLGAKKKTIWKVGRFDSELDAIHLPESHIRRLEDWPPSGIPRKGYLESYENTNPNWLKWKTLQELETLRYEAWQRLLQILIAPDELPPFTPQKVEFFDERIQRGSHESGDQARAVELALSTPDCVLIQGPPGTGKTTVICEIILQALHRGERVLMVAPTHIAVDNVLEQIGDKEGVVAIRLGHPSKVGSLVEQYTLDERAKNLYNQIRSKLDPVHGEQALPPTEGSQDDPLYMIQHEWFEYLQQHAGTIGEDDPIQKLLLLNANLICSTTIGVGSFKELSFEPIFDLMIIDEASKATVVEFLVPAIRAKRWVIVGDHFQLSPYVDRDEVKAILASHLFAEEQTTQSQDFWKLDRNARKPFETRADQIFWRYQQIFEDRLGDQQHSQRYWEDLETTWGVTSSIKLTLEEIRQATLISCFEYFQMLLENKAEETGRFIQLRCQHRMNPAIAEFLDEEIYAHYFSSGQAKSRVITIEQGGYRFNKPLTFLDTTAHQFRKEKLRKNRKGQYYNPLEAELIVQSLQRIRNWALQQPDSPIHTIGVITFYQEQAKEIRTHLNRAPELQRKARYLYQLQGTSIDVEVSVVDRFQGREKDIILLSFTRSNARKNAGFINNLNRLNVAVSRARYMVVMIGDASTLARINKDPEARTPLLTALVEHVNKKDGLINILRAPDQFSNPAIHFKSTKKRRRKR